MTTILKKNLLPFILLFVTLILCIIKPTHLQARKITTTNDLVTSTCIHTPDPKTCETELRSDPRSSAAKDTETLTLIMIDAVKTRFSDSVRVAEDLTRKTHDPAMIRALKDCVRVYRVVLDYNVVTATNAVKQGDPKFGEQAMVDSGNEVEACRSGFPGGKVPDQLAGRSRVLRGVSDVAASLIKTME